MAHLLVKIDKKKNIGNVSSAELTRTVVEGNDVDIGLLGSIFRFAMTLTLKPLKRQAKFVADDIYFYFFFFHFFKENKS